MVGLMEARIVWGFIRHFQERCDIAKLESDVTNTHGLMVSTKEEYSITLHKDQGLC